MFLPRPPFSPLVLLRRPPAATFNSGGPAMPKIHVLHENPDWLPPLAAALDRTGAPWDEWVLVEHAFDLSTPQPEGIFYNRMSPSSPTPRHRFSPHLPAATPSGPPHYVRSVGKRPGGPDTHNTNTPP